MSPKPGAASSRSTRDRPDGPDHLVRSERWHGVRTGDPVIVSGLRIREARWEFRAHVLNRRNGSESIEVVGGRPGDRRVRSFEPDRIFPITGPRRGPRRGEARGRGPNRSAPDRPSLADAPQLPLG